MSPFREEIRELIRASERVFSLESFGAALTQDEREAILFIAADLTKQFSRPRAVKTDGHGQDRHDGKTLADG
jgi:hypothetical protein